MMADLIAVIVVSYWGLKGLTANPFSSFGKADLSRDTTFTG